MPRKPKNTEELEPTALETTENLDLDEEMNEIDVDDEIVDETEELAAEEEEKDEEKKAPKKRAPRKNKRKEPSLAVHSLGKTEEEAEEKPAKEAKEEKAAEGETTEEKIQVSASDETLVPELEDAPKEKKTERKTTKKTETPVEKPFEALEEISASLVANLGRVTERLKEIETKTTQVLQQRPPSKAPAVTKVALVASFIAVILSGVSMVLTQNARQTLSHAEVAVVAPKHRPSAPPEVAATDAFWSKRKLKPSRASDILPKSRTFKK